MNWHVQRRVSGHNQFWTGQWDDEMRETWRRHTWESHRRQKDKWPVGAVLCEVIDLGITVPSWKVSRMSDNRMIRVKDACPEDFFQKKKKRCSVMHNVYWRKFAQKKMRPVKACLDRKFHRLTDRHAAQARSWILSGAWTQEGCARRTGWAAKSANAAKLKVPSGTDHCREWIGERNKIPDVVRTCE